MGRIKVLPTEFWMQEGWREDCGVEEIEPTFHKNNQYLVGDRWWFEIDGKAFTYITDKKRRGAVDMFKYQLEVTDEAILDARELAAVNTILQVSRNAQLKREALALWTRHDHAASIRKLKRDMSRHFRR